jgi:hypothetical protein
MPNDSETSAPPYLLEIVEDVIGKKANRWTVPDCGLSSALRFSVQFEDNSKVFVKAATDEETEQWLRTEQVVLSSMQKEFMPYVIAWIEQPGIHPILITQDLSHAYWSASHNGVTWRDGDIDLLFGAIREISLHTAPQALPGLHNQEVSIWSQIAGDPSAFLRLKLCSKEWFEKSIDALIDAERRGDIRGSCLVHGDVRSDNICILGSRVIFVDWSHAARGYGRHDLATVLPTLHLESGPAPYVVMPDGGHEAAMGCAGHIYRLAVDRRMPQWLKKVFEKLIAIELEWVSKCLNLDEPDGIRWRNI